VLKGDLVTTPLPAVLRQLADGVVSGCLHIDDGAGGDAKVFLRGGQVYAVQIPGRRNQLGARLVSSGALGPEALAEALEAQRTELQGWRLGELLVHLGYVDQPVVEGFVDEQLREAATDLLRWVSGTWKFRVNERTREDVAPPISVEELLASVEQRRAQWDVITEVLHGPDAVPSLSAAGQTDAEMSIDPEAWSLLCKVDGVRSLSELARECGFTLFEAGQVVFSLVRSGLLEVEEVFGPETTAEPAAVEATASVADRLASAFAPAEPALFVPAQAEEMSPADVANLVASALRADRSLELPPPSEEFDVEASVDRVSQALSALLGDTSSTDDLFAAPKPRKPKSPKPKTASEIERDKRAAARAEANAKRRAADAEELAHAQAELEAARAADAQEAEAELASDHEAEVVNLAAARQAAEERVAAEEAARVAEEAARMAAEEEAARVAEEAARMAAEEEAARIAAEEEAARVAEEAARAAAEEEAARIAAEEEAARLAEEAARMAAEEETARVAAEEEAARVAAEEEAARLFAEEAARMAAEEEAARLAAEEEAARAAAEEEAARFAAEEEAARAAAEEEAARLFAEEAARMAAEEEAARRAAEEEARQIAEAHESARRAAEAEERARVEEELRAAAEAQAAEAARRAAEAEAAEIARRAAEAEAAEAARAEAEAAEQARTAEQRVHAADVFAELSASAALSGDTLVAQAPVDTDEDVDDEIDDTPLPTYPPADTDMASLFRELSSLGMEDEPTGPTVPTRPAPRPSMPANGGKQKKKGLFGR
jgi:hypothetical protein